MKFYKWTDYLSQFFCPIPSVLLAFDKPGKVKVKEYSSSVSIDVEIFKSGVRQSNIKGIPFQIIVPGLDINHQYGSNAGNRARLVPEVV